VSDSLRFAPSPRRSAWRARALFGVSLAFGALLGLGGSALIASEAPAPAGPAGPGAPAAPALPVVPVVPAVPVGPVVGALPVGEVGRAPVGWASTVARIADSVVSLKLSQLRDFDDVQQGASTATGFVVDAERGIVLTNRHVVSSGPIRLSATFQNQERVDAVPLYRDPIHDFAFIRYDPAQLAYARPAALPLRPDKVRTGMDIRVIGSDGGEQLSILPGTIARLDRAAPSYGRYGYNDFNTFYLQAASGTSGGSSGSPVIDRAGDVVALNAAANSRTASSFFLPLARVVTALERLRAGEAVPRGGLQTIFSYRPFHELARRGLDASVERRVRDEHPHTDGMLMVQQVIPGGVGDGVLEAGDVLIGVDGRTVTDFVTLEALLDARIGERLTLELVRQGSLLELVGESADLHALAPRRFLELGDAVLQDMSMQHARAMNLPQSGVVVMHPGFFFDRAGIPRGSVIDRIDGRPVVGLDDVVAAAGASPKGRSLLVGYVVPGHEFAREVAQLDIDNRWFGHRSCERVDDARFWDCEPVPLPRELPRVDVSDVMVPGYRDPLLDRVAPGMVRVDFHIPYPTDNVYARHFSGVGLVVDREAGLVAVDRNTVPIGLGDTEITFFGSHTIEGTVVFLHPRHNVALLRFDPDQLGGAGYRALELAGDGVPAPTAADGGLTMIGYRADGTLRQNAVDTLSRVTVGFEAAGLPRFQQAPLDVYAVPDVPPSLGGPLVDGDGRVHAFYTSFAFEVDGNVRQREFAMPAAVIAEALARHRDNRPWYSGDLRLAYRPLALARERGLPDAWLKRFLALDAEQRRVLHVDRVVRATDAALTVRSGDIVLAIDAVPVSNLFEAERAFQRPEVTLSVLRAGQVLELPVRPTPTSTLGTERLVSWGGALFHEPHPDIAFEKGVSFSGVYVASTAQGSPALWDGLYRNRFVTAVDGRPVEGLDDFMALVGAKGQDEITRLSTVSMSGRRSIVAVQPEYNFWPTFEIRRSVEGWQRFDYLN